MSDPIFDVSDIDARAQLEAKQLLSRFKTEAKLRVAFEKARLGAARLGDRHKCHSESNIAVELQAFRIALESFESKHCRRCGGDMKPSKALQNTLVGYADFVGDSVSERGCTVSRSGPPVLIDCLKCESCGWSVTV